MPADSRAAQRRHILLLLLVAQLALCVDLACTVCLGKSSQRNRSRSPVDECHIDLARSEASSPTSLGTVLFRRINREDKASEEENRSAYDCFTSSVV